MFSNSAISASRLENIKDSYDVIVIGGGIHGAAMAWEATSRGLSVILFEKGDYGGGTSANTLKMIHGGIRYIQNLDFPRLRQSVRERRTLLKIAPHLVEPLTCLMPTYRQLTKSRLALWCGTNLYNLLSIDMNEGVDGARALDRSSTLPLAELKKMVPGLKDEEITGGASWCDARAHDTERLVLSFILSAKSNGAHAYNHVKVLENHIENNRITGVAVEDALSGQRMDVRGEVVIDCRGPWLSDNAQLASKQTEGLSFARAMNIVIGRKLCDYAIGLKAKYLDGQETKSRLLFVAPWREGMMVGTWYYQDESSPDNRSIDENIVMQALDELNSVLPSANLTLSDVRNIHLGKLPSFPAENSNSEPELLSDYAIYDRQTHGIDGLYCVQGIKYTTARFVAEKTLDKVARQTDMKINPSVSTSVAIHGGNITDIEQFWSDAHERYGQILSGKVISRLLMNFGSNIDAVVEFIQHDPSSMEPVPGQKEILVGELTYILECEEPLTLADLLLRRSGIGSFSVPPAESVSFCADMMAVYLGWDEAQKRKNIESLYAYYPAWIEGVPRV